MKNKSMYWAIGLIVLALGLIVFSDKAPSTSNIMDTHDSTVSDVDINDNLMDSDNDVVEDISTLEEGSSMPGVFEDYSVDKLVRAVDGDVVLFFHASWCPSCRVLERDINANLDNIPESLSILKVNYDKETKLKKKYGVTYQHTLVQVDANGEMIQKWNGGSTLNTIISKL